MLQGGRRGYDVFGIDMFSLLPAEIVSMIFQMGTESSNFLADFRRRKIDEGDTDVLPAEVPFEILVSHVACRWREISVHKSPLLWTSLDTHRLPSFGLQAYLDRSKLCPIDVRLHANCSHHPGVLEIIIRHVSRWRQMYLYADDCHSIQEHLRSLSAPLLETLSIVTGTPGEMWGVESRKDGASVSQILTNGTATLKSLRLDAMAMRYMCPPLSSVTVLALGLGGMNAYHPKFIFTVLHDILALTPSLSALHIYGSTPLGDDILTSAPNPVIVNLRELRSLRVQIGGHGYIFNRLLFCILAPHLQSLILEDFTDDTLEERHHGTRTLSLLSSKFLSLRHLTFIEFGINERTTDTILHAFPDIEYFTTSQTLERDLLPFIQKIGNSNFRGSANLFWPNLRIIQVQPCYGDDICHPAAMPNGPPCDKLCHYRGAILPRNDVQVVLWDDEELWFESWCKGLH